MTSVVGIVGMGYVGQCLATFLCEREQHVLGFDVDAGTLDLLRSGRTRIHEPELPELIEKHVASGTLRVTGKMADLAACDVVLVTVGTPLGANSKPDLGPITAFADAYGAVLRKGQTIIVKSTVTPGTTRGVVLSRLAAKSNLVEGRDFFLAFAPERLAEGVALADLRRIPVVVGGVSEASGERASAFFRGIRVETLVVPRAEEAEFAKLADNLWIDVNIALANELAMLCAKLGLNVRHVIRAANTLPKGEHHVNILTPGPGVGGSCLTKDPWFVHSLGKDLGVPIRLPEAGRRTNEGMPAYVAELTRALLQDGKPVTAPRVCLVGLAFKGGTNDTRFSPAADVLRELRARGFDVAAWDPLVGSEVARKEFGVQAFSALEEAVAGAHAIVVVTPQPGLRDVPLAKLRERAAPGCVIVDGRFAWTRAAAEAAGFRYVSVGNGGG